MSVHTIVRTAADRAKWLALVGVVVIAGACGKSGTSDILIPSQEPFRPERFSLSGTVLTASDDGAVPVADAVVEISRGGENANRTLTDEDGWYSFSGLLGGHWSVHVRADGYADAETEVDVSETDNVDFMLEPMAP